ncbi:MAG: hypothetical protein DSY80_05705 [Desulfocapsa sp.]|nr:MAG: hypothetical protein DSY80_05705 [Desulfocapsa sp.]
MTNTEIEPPANRVIRKRLAARTIGVHISALPPELQAFAGTASKPYLTKHDLPDEVYLPLAANETITLSRDQAWDFADKIGEQLEWDMMPDNMAGKATALFSSTGQGIYANYGRPTMDFSGFFHDYIRASSSRTAVSQGSKSVLLGPIFIAVDTASAAGFTALGHITRGARLTDKTVLSDVASTGAYEGSTSWISAKLGVLTGANVMRATAALPIPGVHLAVIPLGFLAGATAAILTKRFTNKHKDGAIDALHDSVVHSHASESTQEVAQA